MCGRDGRGREDAARTRRNEPVARNGRRGMGSARMRISGGNVGRNNGAPMLPAVYAAVIENGRDSDWRTAGGAMRHRENDDRIPGVVEKSLCERRSSAFGVPECRERRNSNERIAATSLRVARATRRLQRERRIPLERKPALVRAIGRGEKIRTSDPLHPMQVRYQAALRPDRTANYTRTQGRSANARLTVSGCRKRVACPPKLRSEGSQERRPRAPFPLLTCNHCPAECSAIARSVAIRSSSDRREGSRTTNTRCRSSASPLSRRMRCFATRGRTCRRRSGRRCA